MNSTLINRFLAVFSAVLLLSCAVTAQVSTVDSLDKEYLNWYNLDPRKDKTLGVSTERAYEKMLDDLEPKKKIIVAVIDGGVDIDHEDLKGQIWKNEDEIPDNGKDDDNNGYVDDVYGWNFIGNKEGENLNETTLEYTRIYRKYHDKYDDVDSKDGLDESEQKTYSMYLKAKEYYESNIREKSNGFKQMKMMKVLYEGADETLSEHLGKENYTIEDLEALDTDDKKVNEAKSLMTEMLNRGMDKKRLKRIMDYYDTYVNYYLNTEFDGRALIGDNLEDLSDTDYGNPDVAGPDPFHGTFVAGIIGAKRNNGIGVDGIAEYVEIMAVRCVPNGDEYDKDVALAIRYAVDNGAHIINMSFGKHFSPNKSFVDEALKYAESKNVLLVHAAGNDSENIDSILHYPLQRTEDNTTISTMITVGANSKEKGEEIPGDFSNYGVEMVDLFAPGVDIISLYPEDKYDKANGTSFACPAVSGVAALVWSYYPDLSAKELRDILVESTVNMGRKKVYKPTNESEKEIVRFRELSQTGGIVSTTRALKAARKKSK